MMIRMAVKIPAIPFAMISSARMILDVFIDKTLLIIKNFYKNFVTRLITMPPAITEAICPDTLAPEMCIRDRGYDEACTCRNLQVTNSYFKACRSTKLGLVIC